jgi:hypothetical protein
VSSNLTVSASLACQRWIGSSRKNERMDEPLMPDTVFANSSRTRAGAHAITVKVGDAHPIKRA